MKKVTWVLNVIENTDRVPREYFKKLAGTSGIREVRVQSGSNIFRLPGFMDHGKFVVLTNGFVKKSQKTPKNDTKYRVALSKLQKTENPINGIGAKTNHM